MPQGASLDAGHVPQGPDSGPCCALQANPVPGDGLQAAVPQAVMQLPEALSKPHFDAMLGTRPVRMSPLLALHRLEPQRAAASGLRLPSGASLGLMVAKRHARRAVWRNAIKRQIRESFRLHGLPDGGWLVRLRGSVLPWSEARKREIRSQIDQLLSQVLARGQQPRRPKASGQAAAADSGAPGHHD